MTNTDGTNTQGISARMPRRGRRLALMAACILIGTGIGGTGVFALAAAPWHHGFGLERMQTMAVRVLDGVGATTAQEAKIHDIIATTFTDMDKDRDARQAAGKEMLALLRAPAVDRSAAERLRAAQIAALDQRSKTILAAVLDAADQLSPDQRGKLADRAEAMMQHRHDMMDRGEGPDGGGHRPGNGPDGIPGKN